MRILTLLQIKLLRILTLLTKIAEFQDIIIIFTQLNFKNYVRTYI